jgi:hypothetical protein
MCNRKHRQNCHAYAGWALALALGFSPAATPAEASSTPTKAAAPIAAPIAAPVAAASVRVGDAYSYPTPAPGVPAAGYLTLRNIGKQADQLWSVTSPEIDRIEIHRMTMRSGVMEMRALDQPLALAYNKTVQLAPGGLHLMLYAPKSPLQVGQVIPLTLRFAKSAPVHTKIIVRERPVEESHDHSHH